MCNNTKLQLSAQFSSPDTGCMLWVYGTDGGCYLFCLK